ncbi:MAG: hypothetical protein IKS56_06895 [Lachnospiraceae bacterium]|nr:hypothetical protein [Lachnospiraceae bacterium]
MKNKNRTHKILNRIVSFMIITTVVLSYACQEAKIDPNDYPTPYAVEEKEETAEETGTVSAGNVYGDKVFEPETNTLKEEGKYVYNPLIIPDWILEAYRDNPKIIGVAKDVLRAIDRYDTEFVLDPDITLSEAEIDEISYVIFYSNPISNAVYFYETDVKNVYALEYLPQYTVTEEAGEENVTVEESDLEEVKGIIDGFKDYVTETINNNLNKDMSEREMAAIIYRQLITDISLDVRNTDNYQGLSIEVYQSGELIKGVTDRRYSSGYEFVLLYSFFMTQLHIDTRTVYGAGGYFTQKIKDTLSAKSPVSSYWTWQVLCLDGEYYNCDIVLEKVWFDEEYKGAEDAKPDMLFFGMSDNKRSESFKIGKASVLFFEEETSGGAKVPDCPADFNYLEEL